MSRSNATKNCEPAMNGVAMTTSSEVVKFAHTRSGMRQNVIPGARIVMIVTRKLRAVMIDEAPGPLDAHVEERLAEWLPFRERCVARPACRERASRARRSSRGT